MKNNLNLGCIDIGDGSIGVSTPEDLSVFKGMIQEFQTKKINTYFIDLDGTNFIHSHRYGPSKQPYFVSGVKEALDEVEVRGDKIILVSARKGLKIC